ncbi:hypothetical protein [Promicromonospora iranensis]|jgi:hypothetical protein|uniref:hypothetical protein n=1 Tax=Promicromonospora iranensis TaxID=1105144 RepID=UPI0023A93BCC|nr:hypothetical protein [Promicromonospora iranensis]
MSIPVTLEERGQLARHRSVRAAEKALMGGLLVTSGWFWGTVITTSIIIAAIQGRFGGLEGSTLQYTLGSARWYMFTMGLILAVAVLPLHIAAGGTRRSFVIGLVRTSALVGLLTGLLVAIVVPAERLIWGAIGWDWHFPQGLVPEGSFAVTVAGEALVIATYILAGAMLPAGYQRLGAWGGSLWIVPLVALVVFVDWCMHTGYIFGWEALANPGPGRTLLGLGGGVLAVAVAAFGVDRFYRDMPLRPTLG